MAWYNPFSWGETRASTNAGDYANQVQFQDRSPIMGAITPGLGTNRAAPQAGMDSPFRNAQLGQLGQLQGIMSGQQAGAGELATQRGYQNQLGGIQAGMRSVRGPNAMLAQRGGMDQAAGAGINAQGMGQQAAMGDQMNAHGIAAQVSNAGRQGDQQMQLANLDAQLRQMGMDDAARLGYLQQLTGMDAAQIQAQVGAMGAAQAGNTPGFLGPLLTAGAQVGAAAAMKSDERAKTDITDARHEVDAMLDKLMPKAYVYKEARHGVGRRVGVMAQDLAKSKAGADVIVGDADGQMSLDVNKAISAALASSARLHERVRDLERRKAG